MLDADVAVLLVDHPRNLFLPFTILVVLAESVELHVGRLILESVVHVNVTVCADELIAVFLILPPVAPFAFNVMVFVFALHDPVIVAVPLHTPRFALVHATLVLALNCVVDVPLVFHLLNVYPVAVIAAGVVNDPSYVQLFGVVGAVPCPPFA